MRKKNWLVSIIALGLGIVLGIAGFAVLASPAASESFISFLGKANSRSTVSSVSTPGPVLNQPNANAANPADNPDNTLNNTPKNTTTNNSTDNSAANPSTNPNESSNNSTTNPANNSAEPSIPGVNANSGSTQMNQEIITAYKQDLGVLFDAWKAPDMTVFRTKLAKAYTGELFEKHARQAELFLVRGVGLDVSQIQFDQLVLEKADTTTATLRADYRYTARDFNLADAAPIGEEQEQTVHVRVNMIKLNGHWLITGETPLTTNS